MSPVIPADEVGTLTTMIANFRKQGERSGRPESGWLTEIPQLIKGRITRRNMGKFLPVFYGLPESEQDEIIKKVLT